MANPRPVRWSIFAVSLIILIGVIYALASNSGSDPHEWFPGALAGILACLAAGVMVVGREIHVAAVSSLLLASLSSLIGISPSDWIDRPGVPGYYPGLLVNLAWYGFSCLAPFLFVHLSLIFPVPNQWIERDSRRLSLLYVPYMALLTPLEWQVAFATGPSGIFETAMLLLFPAGFATGLAIFIYQYLVALTAAEKNRLRVILIGCLAGGVPYVLLLAGRTFVQGERSFWEYLAYFLVPLFPLTLVFAVLRENFYDVGRVFQKILVYSLVLAGAISMFYLSFLLLRSQPSLAAITPSTEVPLALLLTVIVAYPLQRWARAYVSSHFYRAPERPAQSFPLPEFKPIQPNPYIVGNPVQSPEMFFGRKEEFHLIRTRLLGQHEGCIILLYGERRAGKTSILHQVVNGRLGSRFVPVFVDMQGLVVENDCEFLRGLAFSVAEPIRAQGSGGRYLLPGNVEGYAGFTAFMDEAMGEIGGRQLIVLVDEYELIEHKVGQGKIKTEIFDYTTSLLERFPRQLSLILTGSRSLEAHPAWHSLLGKSIARKISFLSPRDATDLICDPLKDQVAFSPEAVGDLIRLTHGQPFFTQLLCQTTVELLNEQRGNRVGRDTVSLVAERVLENPPPQLLYQWNGFPASEKLLLAALAALLKTPESYASSEWVNRSIQSLPREHRTGLDRARIRMLLEGLRQRDVLDRDQTRYRFTMDLMRRWIRFEHSIWAVLHQIREHGDSTE